MPWVALAAVHEQRIPSRHHTSGGLPLRAVRIASHAAGGWFNAWWRPQYVCDICVCSDDEGVGVLCSLHPATSWKVWSSSDLQTGNALPH
jgi:hypothetical protein